MTEAMFRAEARAQCACRRVEARQMGKGVFVLDAN